MIRNLLENANGKRIALIINEFGDLGVDGDVLKGCGVEACREDDIIELNNGCICCTVADDFIPTMTKLLDRAGPPDHIVIETSGLALPQPLVAAFNWPEIKTQVTVDGVVTVVDAPPLPPAALPTTMTRSTRSAPRTNRSITTARSRSCSKTRSDCRRPDRSQQDRSAQRCRPDWSRSRGCASAGPRARRRWSRQATASSATELLLGLGVGTEDDIANRKSHHEMEHEAGEEHDHDEFESFVVDLGPIADAEVFVEKLKHVIAEHDVLRLKGFVDVPGKPMRLVIQAVGSRIDQYFDRSWTPGEERQTRLVVIGLHDMDTAAICRRQ